MQAHDKTIGAGEFKAKCLNLMDKVNKQQRSIVITKHGKPIAKLVPYAQESKPMYGVLKGTVTIKGDIIAPIDEKWSVDEE